MRLKTSILFTVLILFIGLACQFSIDLGKRIFPQSPSPLSPPTGRLVSSIEKYATDTVITTTTMPNIESEVPNLTPSSSPTTEMIITPAPVLTDLPTPVSTSTLLPTQEVANTEAPDLSDGVCDGADTAVEENLLNLINSQRSSAGLGQVSLSSSLTGIARNYSKSMAENGFFNHGDVWQRVNASGAYTAVGEIIYAGPGPYNSAAEALSHWLDSADHKKKMLNPIYTLAGVGYWCDPNSSHEGYYTVDFARP